MSCAKVPVRISCSHSLQPERAMKRMYLASRKRDIVAGQSGGAFLRFKTFISLGATIAAGLQKSKNVISIANERSAELSAQPLVQPSVQPSKKVLAQGSVVPASEGGSVQNLPREQVESNSRIVGSAGKSRSRNSVKVGADPWQATSPRIPTGNPQSIKIPSAYVKSQSYAKPTKSMRLPKLSPQELLLAEILKVSSESDLQSLLDAGLRPETVNSYRLCALHFAARHRSLAPELIDFLVRHDWPVDAQASTGESCLFYAVRVRHSRLVDTLLKNGADVNLARGDGSTPMHQAVAKDCYDQGILLKLLAAGGNVELENNYGKSPLILAKEENLPAHQVIQKFLAGEITEPVRPSVTVDADLHQGWHQRDAPLGAHIVPPGHRLREPFVKGQEEISYTYPSYIFPKEFPWAYTGGPLLQPDGVAFFRSPDRSVPITPGQKYQRALLRPPG